MSDADADAAQLGEIDTFTERERAALRYAEAMHRSPAAVDKTFVDVMLMQFSPAEFLELAFAVAQFISMGQLVHLLGLPNPAPRQ